MIDLMETLFEYLDVASQLINELLIRLASESLDKV